MLASLPDATRYRVYVSSGMAAAVATCRVDEVPLDELGEKAAVIPLGRAPNTLKVTVPLRLVRNSCTAYAAAEPGARVAEAGAALIDKNPDSG